MATKPGGGGLKTLVSRPLRKELFLRLPLAEHVYILWQYGCALLNSVSVLTFLLFTRGWNQECTYGSPQDGGDMTGGGLIWVILQGYDCLLNTVSNEERSTTKINACQLLPAIVTKLT